MALFDTVTEQLELGPASELASGTTADSGNDQYTVKGTDTSWDQFVRKGDLIVLNNADSALIVEVVDATTLKISKPIAQNSVPYRIMRPTEAFLRPHPEWEWEIHSIVASPRVDAGSDESMALYPVEVWATDDNLPRTLLLRSDENGLDRKDLLIKPTYFNWLLIRNYQPVRVDVYINGIDKTIRRE